MAKGLHLGSQRFGTRAGRVNPTVPTGIRTYLLDIPLNGRMVLLQTSWRLPPNSYPCRKDLCPMRAGAMARWTISFDEFGEWRAKFWERWCFTGHHSWDVSPPERTERGGGRLAWRERTVPSHTPGTVLPAVSFCLSLSLCHTHTLTHTDTVVRCPCCGREHVDPSYHSCFTYQW
jgi:hypothetical protein